jgi:HEAT repeat protein
VEDNQAPAPLGSVISQLTSGQDIEDRDYGALSDLTDAEAVEVRHAWPQISPELREAVLSHAADLAEERVGLEFSSLARIGLDDSEANARLSALEAVGDSTDRGIGARLCEMLDNDPDARVRAGVAAALRQFVMAHEFDQFHAGQGEAIVAALRQRLEDAEEDVLVRALSLEALGPRSAGWLPVKIELAYASEVRDMRLAALRAMADSCDERWLEYVYEQAESDDQEFRYEAAVAAGAIGSADAVEPISHLLADDDPSVVAAAIEALGEIGGSAALEELRAFAPHVPEGLEATLNEATAMAREIAALEDGGDEDDEDDD